MATIAKLAVALEANTGKFSAGLKKASKETETFTNTLGKSFASIGKAVGLGLAGAATAAAVAMAHITKEAFENIDAMAKMAAQVGTTTQVLSGLRYAAKAAGATSEDMDTAMAQLARRIGSGDKGVVAVIEGMGMSFKDFAALDAGKRMLALADGFSRMANQEQKAAAANELFGRSGVGLINTLSQGRDALRDSVREAASLGVIVSGFDASKIERADDSMDRLKGAIEGMANAAAIRLAPVIERIGNTLTKYFVDGNLGKAMVEFAEVGLRALELLSAPLLKIANLVALIGKNLGEVGNQWLKVAGKFWMGEEPGYTDQQFAKDQTAKVNKEMDLARQRDHEEMLRWRDRALLNGIKSRAMGKLREWGPSALEGIDRIFAGARASSNGEIENRNLNSARDRMGQGIVSDLMTDVLHELPRAVATAASTSAITGTRGTFSSELGGRMNTTSIATQQLDQAKQMTDLLKDIADNTAAGAVVGE